MKIKNIELDDNNFSIYSVTFTPNWLERLFKMKEKTKQYKNTGKIYKNGGGNVYIDKNGNELSNGYWIGDAIDKWRKKW